MDKSDVRTSSMRCRHSVMIRLDYHQGRFFISTCTAFFGKATQTLFGETGYIFVRKMGESVRATEVGARSSIFHHFGLEGGHVLPLFSITAQLLMEMREKIKFGKMMSIDSFSDITVTPGIHFAYIWSVGLANYPANHLLFLQNSTK